MRSPIQQLPLALCLMGILGIGEAVAQQQDFMTPPPAASASPSIVTRQIAGFQEDSARLQSRVADAAQRDDALRAERRADESAITGWVDQINARLAAGTTRGNPDLVVNWQHAQAALEALDRSMALLPQSSAEIAQSVALAGYLENSIKAAYALQGATDSEHAQLIALQQSAAQSATTATALARRINGEMDAESTALDATHRRMTSLRHAIDIGVPLDSSLTLSRPGRSASSQ